MKITPITPEQRDEWIAAKGNPRIRWLPFYEILDRERQVVVEDMPRGLRAGLLHRYKNKAVRIFKVDPNRHLIYLEDKPEEVVHGFTR